MEQLPMMFTPEDAMPDSDPTRTPAHPPSGAQSSAGTFDIAICGAGPVGLALAGLLVGRGIAPQRIALLDAKPLDKACADPRSIALSYGSSQMLQDLGAWPLAASTIREIHVSRRGYFGRTLIDAAEYDLPALGYVTRYGALVEALSTALEHKGIRAMRPATVTAIDETEAQVELHLADGTSITAGLVVQAEGGVFGDQADKVRSHDYQQTAIVGQVAVSAPLPQRAFERFTDEGPLALLPQTGPAAQITSSATAGTTVPTTHYALVWCMRPENAQRLMAIDDAAFLAALQTAFGDRVGRFQHIAARNAYPLGLNADPAATARTVAIGNAAQTLHPVAGQGLNLGLRDASVLARLLANEQSPATLQAFLRERRIDRGATIRLTDTMARVFAGATAGMTGVLTQSLMGVSLGAIDAIAPARRVLAEQMMYGRR
jgi:2-octaprenyl-6-methoxyphenol hydroxylase